MGMKTATAFCAVAVAICGVGCDQGPSSKTVGSTVESTASVKSKGRVSGGPKAPAAANKGPTTAQEPSSPKPPKSEKDPLVIERIRTDSPGIAVGNLLANLKAVEAQLQKHPKSQRLLSKLVRYHLQRARFLGQTDSYLRAAILGEQAVADDGASAKAYLLRATARSSVHRFKDALADLKEAEKRGTPAALCAERRQSMELSMGSASTVLPIWARRAKQAPTWTNLSRFGAALEEAGRYVEADKTYVSAFRAYRQTSAFVAAWFMFKRGVLWAEKVGNTARGRRLYEEAVHYLPDYLVANIHLAELEAEAGQVDEAIKRLERLAGPNKDPEIFGKLSGFYKAKGDLAKAKANRALAVSGYDRLLKVHRGAWADHGAEFFMGAGADPKRALRLALFNVEHRQTERAHALVLEAAVASGDAAQACRRAREMEGKSIRGVRLREAKADALKGCP